MPAGQARHNGPYPFLALGISDVTLGGPALSVEAGDFLCREEVHLSVPSDGQAGGISVRSPSIARL